MKVERIKIFGGKATMHQNKFGVWQFRMWVSADKRYVEKSLREKVKARALTLAEDMYEKVIGDIAKGKTIFSIDVRTAVDKFISERQAEVDDEVIGEGYLKAVKSHLSHFVKYVGEKEKVGNLSINTLLLHEIDGEETTYFQWRLAQGVGLASVRNEISSINSCMRYLFEVLQVTTFATFRLPKAQMKKVQNTARRSGDEVRRLTFTHDEWKSFYTAMRGYKSKLKNRITDDEYVQRQLFRHWCLFAANSGLRNGEQRQLKWEDVKIEKEAEGKIHLAEVVVGRMTSKVRRGRTFYTQGAEYLQRWKKIQKDYGISTKGLVFSTDGENEWESWRLHKHWRQLLSLTDIDEEKRLRLVPYSLRHLAITNYVLSGNSLTDVAFTCGTSVRLIESVYYHLRTEKMRSVATKRFVRRKGKIYPLGAKTLIG